MAGPTQFVSGETRRWWLGYGSGTDGDLTISGNTTEAPIDSACTGTATQTSLSATNASFAVGQAILIHQTQGTGAGQYELNQITGYTAGTITLRSPLYYSYTTGAQVRVLKQYKNVTINNGVTYTAKAWNGTVGGILGFLANGTVTVTGAITATGRGFRGGVASTTAGASSTGEGTVGASAVGQRAANGNGGGTGLNVAGAGGGGGHAAAGTDGGNPAYNGSGGLAVGTAGLTTLFLGGGGGAGNAADSQNDGGGGGGIIFIIGKAFTSTGSVLCSGVKGGDSTPTSNGCGGGGGAGGSILLKSQTATLGTMTAAGGALGDGFYDGGAGSVGRIHLDHVVSYSGSTTPAIDVTQDLTLRQPIRRRMTI